MQAESDPSTILVCSVLFWSRLGLGNSSINSGFVKEDLSNRYSLYVAQDRTGQDNYFPTYAC